MAVSRPPATVSPKAFVVLVGVLGLAALAAVYGSRLNGPPIRSDGMGYYLYLPAAVIDHDLTLQRTVARSFGGQPPEWAGVNRVPNSQRLLIKYPPGEAMLLAPFFLLAHGATLAAGSGGADGFSTLYQAAAAVAGLCYLLLGLYVLQRLLTRSYSPPVVWLTLVTMVFGTNLFHYGTYDSIFSHAFSFCLFTLFLAAVERWYARPAAGSTLGLAVVAGLITLVRPTNSVIFVFALLFGVGDGDGLRERARFLRSHAGLAAAGMLVYAAALSPLFAYWKHVTRRWIIFSYTGESFDFAHPQLTNVLFSVRKGLFFWSPALLVATAGLLLMKKYKREYFVAALVYVALNLYIVASWRDWAYGGSFGHRAFVESIAVLAFGYASVVQRAFDLGHRRLATIVSCAFAALSTRLMVAYWLGAIPFDHTTWQQFVAALRW
jgi:hypothetical protein